MKARNNTAAPSNHKKAGSTGFWKRVTRRDRAPAARLSARAAAYFTTGRGEEFEPVVLWPRVVNALAAACTLGLLVAVAFSYDVWSQRTLQFKVRQFVVDGNHWTADAVVIAATALREGSALLGVDERAIAGRVRALPWVRDVEVQVQMPGTLAVKVVEHEPAALVVDGAIWVIDATGRVIKRKASDERVQRVLLSGVAIVDLMPVEPRVMAEADASLALLADDGRIERLGRHARAVARVNAMLALHDRVLASPLGQRFKIGEVNWDAVVGATLVRDGDGAQVRLGHRDLDDLDHTLELADRLLATLDTRGESLLYALFDDPVHPDRAVVATKRRGSVANGGAAANIPGGPAGDRAPYAEAIAPQPPASNGGN